MSSLSEFKNEPLADFTKPENKSAMEAELYGLHIRHLLGPVENHTFPPFRKWNGREQGAFPNENESHTARLGVFGAVGFLLLLVCVEDE